MSYLQPFNYSFVQFPGAPFGQTTSRFSPYNSPSANQLLPQPQQQAAQFPIPPSITSSTDYYGNPSYNTNHQIQQHQIYNQNNENHPNMPTIPRQAQSSPNGSQPRRKRPKSSRTRSVEIANPNDIRVTPIQGPIYAKDGHVPVVPLYSYPSVNNGTFYQIPILWTALSYALGLEIRGEILRGLPCIKRLNQLFCPTAGQTYPVDRIERFIDENKALIKRMYGEFSMNAEAAVPGTSGANTLRRSAREVYEDEVPNLFQSEHFINNKGNQVNKRSSSTMNNATDSESHVRTSRQTVNKLLQKRQTVNPRNGTPTQQPKSNRVDSCESTVEIVTPYWAANSSGKVRAIVNTQHFEQAIHQEVCAKTTTKRCAGDCMCEQKYKWHRLLAYEPDNDCRGIFMDWFLFPSCCVCRCNPT